MVVILGYLAQLPLEGAAWSLLYLEACGTSEQSERLTRIAFPSDPLANLSPSPSAFPLFGGLFSLLLLCFPSLTFFLTSLDIAWRGSQSSSFPL